MVTSEGEVWSFGSDGWDGRLGHGDRRGRIFPHRVLGLPRMRMVACGGMARSALSNGRCDPALNPDVFSGALSSNHLHFTPRGVNLAVLHAGFCVGVSCGGEVFVWGDGAHGCLGLGHLAACFAPRPLPALAGIPVLEVAAGGAHCVLVTKDNVVMAWGLGKLGQLGTGSRSRQMMPVEVTALRRRSIVRVAAAGSFSGFVSEDGSLYMCGCGWDGQLGLGDREGRLYPEKVTAWKKTTGFLDELEEEEEEEEKEMAPKSSTLFTRLRGWSRGCSTGDPRRAFSS
mmetsp:Transcript_18553/g.42344  ORF Transcript_18553/g.42344 Transcript_18553/m.42344 type:complete len:285 (+) Transcript_18553:588-1442(+)